MVKVFYGDSTLLFTGPGDPLPDGFQAIPGGGSHANIIENLDKYKRVALVSPDPGGAFREFKSRFQGVDAAGGVVADTAGRLLMIHRGGRWDLPKGHREPGEEFAACALREVEEETGIAARLAGRGPVCTTMHFYPAGGEWELKTTQWYRMGAIGGNAAPQSKEGITSVEWVQRERVAEYARTCFPSVREVMAAAGWTGESKI